MTIEATNNGDGTATVTVTDSGGGSVTVYATQVGTTWASSISWSSVGSRTGDGTATATTGKGAFWLYALTGSTPSPPIYLYVSDGTETVTKQIRDKVQARIRNLSLSGINSANVEVFDILDEHAVKAVRGSDRILIAPGGGESDTDEGPIQVDDWEHPFVIVHALAINAKTATESERERWRTIRERIRRAFINQTLGCDDYYVRCQSFRAVDPIHPQFWDEGILASILVPVFTAREPRGV